MRIGGIVLRSCSTALGSEAGLLPFSAAALWNLLVASLIGALAGHELAVDIRSPPVPTLIGAASGVIAAVLIASSAITVVWAKNNLSMADIPGNRRPQRRLFETGTVGAYDERSRSRARQRGCHIIACDAAQWR